MNSNTQSSLVEFFQNYNVIQFVSKEIIYRPDESIDRVAFIKKGIVRVYNHTESGKEITYSGFKPVFYLSLYYSTRKISNQYFFQALTDVEIWQAPLEDFHKYLLNQPQLSLDLIDSCLGSFTKVLESWENSISGDAYIRVAKLLLMLAKDYCTRTDNRVIIDFHTTHQLISSMLGISRETASIQIKRLENEGWLTQSESTITVVDYPSLFATFSQLTTPHHFST